MKPVLRAVPLVGLLGWLSAPRFFDRPAVPEAPDADAARLASTDVVLDLVDDARPEEITGLARKYGLHLRPNSFLEPRTRIQRTQLAPELLPALAREPLVEAVEPDVEYSLYETFEGADFATSLAGPSEPPDQPRSGYPDDPKFGYQWHLAQIRAPEAWSQGGGAGVVVAVIDTGVAFEDHAGFKKAADLAQTELVPGYNFVADTPHANDDHGHGTHVAGTIAQSTNNGIGVAGVAFRARIMPLKVLSASGSGNVADIAEAIRFAADNGAQVINMSLGGRFSSKVMEKAVAYAIQKGTTVVAAAGNEGRTSVGYPAGYDGVIAVASTQFDESLAFYSNRGKKITLSAPGGNTRVDQNGDGFPDGVLQNTILPGEPDRDGYLFYMGTSMASPHVAGVAALVVATGVTEPEAVRRVLVETSRAPRVDCKGACGSGIVDAAAAVERSSLGLAGVRVGLGAALLLALGGFGLLARRGGLGLVALGLVAASAGLPWLTAAFGGGGRSLLGLGLNPVVYSAIPVVLALGLGFGVRRLRPVLVGVTIGAAATLLFFAFSGVARVAILGAVPGLGTLWLLANGVALALLGRLALRASAS